MHELVDEIEVLRARNAFLEDWFKNQSSAIERYINQGVKLARAEAQLANAERVIDAAKFGGPMVSLIIADYLTKYKKQGE
jgi:hypothetical protein